MSTVIISGNPVDGLQVTGPFPDQGDAVSHAALNFDGDWWVAELVDPAEHSDQPARSLPTDYCPQCCVVHVTCECPREGESYIEYWRRMERLAEERAS